MKPTAEASMTVELHWKRSREDGRTRFERAWRDHGPALSRVMASYARPGADQQDLAQDVALALWSALPRFRGESTEKTFVLMLDRFERAGRFGRRAAWIGSLAMPSGGGSSRSRAPGER